jgi:tetratricopeptide (TPR) repeat protein
MDDSQPIETAKSFFISGLEKLNTNNFTGAEIDFELSLNFAPNRLSTLINLSIVLIKLNKFENAEKLIHKSLLHYPKNKELLMGLVEIYSILIKYNPEYAEAHTNLGNSYKDLNMYDEALASYNHAINLNPNLAQAYSNRGSLQQDLKKYQEAVEDYEKAIEINPDFPDAYSCLGIALIELKRFDEALASFEQAIEINPNYANAYLNRGIALNELKQFDEALANYNRAIEINPSFAEAYSNRGNTLKELNRLDDALASYNQAIEIKPDFAEAYLNRGLLSEWLLHYRDAILDYDRAIAVQPNYLNAYFNKALCLLRIGDFKSGLNLYEWRWKVGELELRNLSFTQPLWLGDENIQNKTILLHAEQGLGDTIQFCRYAKLVKELGARVLLEVPKSLLDLLNGLEGVDQLIEIGKPLPDSDYHCPLMSLPLAFKTELASIPNRTPYLAAANNKHEKWAQKLGVKPKLLVGLVWSGNNMNSNDHNRSLTLKQLLPYLSDLCGYVSLQKEVREIDKQVLNGSNIKQFGDELNDFSDTAALCELMDLVISVDTSVAHLAGAIGKTTWVLLPHVPDWRWLLDREDSPWYPSIKIYRQTSPGDWDSVIQRVRQDLIEYSNNFNL